MKTETSNETLPANNDKGDVMGSALLAVLVSGGRSSAMMARHIQTSKKYDGFEKLFIFCNTGMERPETIDFLKDMVKHWNLPLNIIEGVYSNVAGIGVKHKVVDFDTMDMEGKVFTQAIEHLNKLKWTGVPNPATPYCSEYLKTRVSHSFTKEIFGTTKYLKAIGYRAEDIPKRITLAELKIDKVRIAPLLTDFEKPVNMVDLTRYFENQMFRLSIPSRLGNCELCWKKSEANLIESIRKGTRFIDWHIKEEDKYNNRFFRNNLSITDLVRMAEEPMQLEMFDDEIKDGCVCTFA